jgi:orotate phosphoribosyltransferase
MSRNEGSASDLYKMLMKTGCLKFGVFKLKKGRLSPYYLDLKRIPSYPNGMNRVVSIYEDLVKKEVGGDSFDRILGIPVAGMSFASVLSYKLSKPFLYLKESAEIHGREKKIQGILSPGDSVLLVDDVVTSGKSIIDAAEVVRGEGGTVTDALVLVDREEGGAQKLARAGVKLHSFVKMSDIARVLVEAELIDERQYQEIVKHGAVKRVVRS